MNQNEYLTWHHKISVLYSTVAGPDDRTTQQEMNSIEAMYERQMDEARAEYMGASKEAYNKLPVVIVTERKEGVVCSICIEEYKKGMIVM